MKKIFVNFVLIAFSVALLAVALPAGATTPNWNITGNWNLDFNLGGSHYLHTMTVTIFDPTTGAFSGTGVYNPDLSYTWTVTGTVSGNDITYHNLYTGTNSGYTVDVTGTITSATSMSGTWRDSNGASGTWTGDGTAVLLPTITDLATNITPTSATINGTVGGADADYTSFWLGTTPISDPSPSVSPTLPTGWSHTDFPGTYPANTPFSQALVGLTPNTQYYFVAWARTVGTGNTWYPGAVQSFTTTNNTGTLIVNKDTVGGDDTFDFTGVPNGFSITTNGGTGSETLSDLTPGTYSISESAADGWNLTSNDCTNVSVVAGQVASCVITNTKQASISGMKYNDKNRNGKQDEGELGLQGWVIRLMLDDPVTDKDTLVAKATTDADGNYTFSNVAPGTYDVRETHQKGWKRMSKNPQDIVITAGSVVTDVNFGNAKIKKGEREDTNQDDNCNDQPGNYYGNHGLSHYDKDQNGKDHDHPEFDRPQNNNGHDNNGHGNDGHGKDK